MFKKKLSQIKTYHILCLYPYFQNFNILYSGILHKGESNGKLPLRTCPGCGVSEPYQSPDWALVPAKPDQGLNTHYYYLT